MDLSLQERVDAARAQAERAAEHAAAVSVEALRRLLLRAALAGVALTAA